MDEREWEQWDSENEPDLWYERFLCFLEQGAARTMIDTVRMDDETRGISKPRRSVPNRWFKIAERYDWRGRASAYDKYRRKAFMARNKKCRQMLHDSTDQLIERVESVCNDPNANPRETFETLIAAMWAYNENTQKKPRKRSGKSTARKSQQVEG